MNREIPIPSSDYATNPRDEPSTRYHPTAMDRPKRGDAEDSSEDALLPELVLAAAFEQRTARGPDRQHDALHAGVQLGAYRVLHRIGSGAMGTVYAARQSHPEREVALKLLSPTHASKAMVRRFQREARLLGSLQHAGIAQVYEAGSVMPEGLTIPIHYLALELVNGVSLIEWVETRAPALNERLELVAHICDAVQHAHQRGVLHRDLKPSNVLVVEGDDGGTVRPKVLDFGVARTIGDDRHTIVMRLDGFGAARAAGLDGVGVDGPPDPGGDSRSRAAEPRLETRRRRCRR